MFIYNFGQVEKLIAIATSRERIENDPNLCKLLENPYLKDDTELAIRYNEYKRGKPNAAKELVDYFYYHGPELDTGTLKDWRDIIIKDPTLHSIAKENEIRLDEITNEKFKTTDPNFDPASSSDYSALKGGFLGNLFDCLSRPCSYTEPISELLGTCGDSNSKYNLKNIFSDDDEASMTLTGLPSYINNKLPNAITKGIAQLNGMIRNEFASISGMINGAKPAKQDAFELSRAELIGGDILADIASSFGDCFRLVEYAKRYNPYDYNQNMTVADTGGITIRDTKGVTHNVSLRGNPISPVNNTKVMSDNSRLNSNKNTIDVVADNVADVSPDRCIPFEVTCYNCLLQEDGSMYADGTIDKWSQQGLTCTKYTIVPNDVECVRTDITEADRKNGITSKDSFRPITYGVATRPQCIMNYFVSLAKSKFPNENVKEKLSALLNKYNANVAGNVFVRAKLPQGGVIELPVIDRGRSGAKYDSYHSPWIDITAQYFMEPANMDKAKLIGKVSATNQNKQVNVGTPVTKAKLDEVRKKCERKGKLISIQIPGAGLSKSGCPLVQGLFYFSDNLCAKFGLDPKIYGDPAKHGK